MFRILIAMHSNYINILNACTTSFQKLVCTTTISGSTASYNGNLLLCRLIQHKEEVMYFFCHLTHCMDHEMLHIVVMKTLLVAEQSMEFDFSNAIAKCFISFLNRSIKTLLMNSALNTLCWVLYMFS